jgi:hypothetical protein
MDFTFDIDRDRIWLPSETEHELRQHGYEH